MVIYQNDHLGTPQKLTAVNGAVVWSAKYSSFGKAEVYPSSTVTNHFRYPGQYFDQETSLHYNFQRFYDPNAGRYLRVDPIGIKGGINQYSYALNNPKAILDPLGLMSRKPPTPVFYDIFSETFLKEFKENYPVEFYLFEQYAKNRPINHWPSYMYPDRQLDDNMLLVEVEYFLEELDEFECYARGNATRVLGEKFKDFYASHYGYFALISKLFQIILWTAVSESQTLSEFPGIRETSMEVSRIISIGPSKLNRNSVLDEHGHAPVYMFYLKMKTEELKRK